MTEQGETIAQRYANRITAVHNLELLMAGTIGATLRQRRVPPEPHPLEPVMDRLAETSRRAYEALIGADGFITFFGEATPIDAIESSSIGSRPARRTGERTLQDLRAIPWVFSWSQARFYLSGWYGVGTALEDLQNGDPEAFEALCLVKSGREWMPLHYILSNAATSVITADTGIMHDYAGLVRDAALRDRIMGRITAEYDRTRRILDRVYGGPLPEVRPRIYRTVMLRQEGLRILHRQQIDLLRLWRGFRLTQNHRAAEAELPKLLLTINAIAGGLGTTG